MQESKCPVFSLLVQHQARLRDRQCVVYTVVIIAWLWVFMLLKMWSKQFVINSLWAKVIGTPLLEIFRYWIGTLLSYVLRCNQVCRPEVEEDDLQRWASLGRNC